MAMRKPNGSLRPRLPAPLLAFLLLATLWGTSIPGLTVTSSSDPHGADVQPYLDQVQKSIANEWMRRSQPDWPSDKQVILRISVDRSGKVLKVVFVSPSRVRELDHAVVQAVTACSPYPPLPEAFQGDRMELHLKFAAR